MEFENLQFQGINMGACGKFDLDFLHVVGIKWPWMESVIKTGCYGQAAADEAREPQS